MGCGRCEVFEAGGKAEIVPDEKVAVTMATNLDARHAVGPEDMDPVLVGGDHVNLGLKIKLGHVVDAAFERAVAPHVVDDPTGGDHKTVSALFDSLDVTKIVVIGLDLTVGLHLDRAPVTVDVRSAIRSRLRAASEDRARPGRPSISRSERDRDVINAAHQRTLQ
jgi:hypothetical protein